MDEFSLLHYFSEQPASDGGTDARSLATPCGLEAATPIDGQSAGIGDAGLVVEVDGQLYDLGDDEGSITLADDSGLSIYSDLDGDGAVDHVTTVRFDGTWESWSSDDVRAADVIGKAAVEATPAAGKWDAYSWEQSARGSWN
ncbi:DUF6802 family protein [Corynebacterium amycolatum]|uniref:DUF6802 family protein n=1 Tax=Corynebacterium amycolatum TaxID=43765 RepID=UPI00223C3E7A|nr:DUF6802 family protein [Corynebacterium amycolatum]MCT1547991.1 hypothetical protein [Corynebacterium amycolatum]MDK8727002.1 hypothetical protein [Corynebacterium amycolatum]